MTVILKLSGQIYEDRYRPMPLQRGVGIHLAQRFIFLELCPSS